MNKIRPYLLVVCVLALAAGPWLRSSMTNAASGKARNNCTQDSSEACCCCVADAKPIEQPAPDQPTDGCGCEFSAVPFVPDMPLESSDRRTDYQSVKTLPITLTRIEPTSDFDWPAAIGDPLPKSKSPPAYILFGAFLN